MSAANFGELGMSLAGIITASEYTGSLVQESCHRLMCQFANYSGLGDSCSTAALWGATNSSALCFYASSGGNTTNATTPAPPTPAPTPAPPTPAPRSGAAAASVMTVLAAVALLL
jgi:hypothetical protein